MTIKRIEVVLIQNSLAGRDLAGRQVALIDVLRATTTMVTALANGARAIIPVAEPSQAVEVRSKLDADSTLLGGERDALPIENFDLGNSPLEYTEEVVRDKTIVMCTTNGTKLLTAYKYSGPVWLASFLNVSAICEAMIQSGLDVTIVCAGNAGDFSLEDTLCAGALVDELLDKIDGEVELNDSAKLALLHYNANREDLPGAMRQGEHGRRLAELGFGDDIAASAEINRRPLAPQFTEGKVSVTADSPTQRIPIQPK